MMNEITGDLIRSAVAKIIIAAIPSAKGKVYKEPQDQNITTDVYYITQRKVTQTPQLGKIMERDYEIIVRYETLPDTKKALEKCGEVANELMWALRAIVPDTLTARILRGHDMNYTIVDGVLQVYVTYTMRIVEIEELTPMQILDIERRVY